MLDRLVDDLAFRKPASQFIRFAALHTIFFRCIALLSLALLCVADCTQTCIAGTTVDYLSKQQVPIKSLGCYGLPVVLKIGPMRMNGTYLTYVFSTGRARSNSLHQGDIVLKVNNVPTATPEALNTVLGSLKDQPVTLDIAQGNSKIEIKRVPLLQSGNQKNQYGSRSVAELESLMYQLIDEDRRAKGLSRVQQSSTLARMARTYADDMAKRGFMGHKDPEGRGPAERAKLLGIQPKYMIAENACYPYPQTNPLDMVRDGERTLMESPDHSVTILNPNYQSVGVGIAYRRDGGLMVVQEFSPQRMP